MAKKTYVSTELTEAAKTFEERSKVYGEAYRQHGDVMSALLPEGVELVEALDYNRYGVLNMIVSKLVRYAHNFEEGGHKDSLHDISVYAAMLNDLDENG